MANHFILDRPNKKQINLTYRPNTDPLSMKYEDPKVVQQQRFVAVRCRSSKIKPLFRRSSQSSSAGSSIKSKASTILDQVTREILYKGKDQIA